MFNVHSPSLCSVHANGSMALVSANTYTRDIVTASAERVFSLLWKSRALGKEPTKDARSTVQYLNTKGNRTAIEAKTFIPQRSSIVVFAPIRLLQSGEAISVNPNPSILIVRSGAE